MQGQPQGLLLQVNSWPYGPVDMHPAAKPLPNILLKAPKVTLLLAPTTLNPSLFVSNLPRAPEAQRGACTWPQAAAPPAIPRAWRLLGRPAPAIVRHCATTARLMLLA